MISGKVIGTATATIKHPTLEGWKLLVIRTDMEPYIAVDHLGAGIGDEVMITSDGKFTSELIGTKVTPIRWSVIGITDKKNRNGLF
ncbi:MAG: EutN/CcmL family microcompartment protein [Planctomycetaceae bacterium]|jgi:ethanolamine utilization protein EutN|nr:EutN/CcmL family microcompartment protein [Planctomycetaceae bacterium]